MTGLGAFWLTRNFMAGKILGPSNKRLLVSDSMSTMERIVRDALVTRISTQTKTRGQQQMTRDKTEEYAHRNLEATRLIELGWKTILPLSPSCTKFHLIYCLFTSYHLQILSFHIVGRQTTNTTAAQRQQRSTWRFRRLDMKTRSAHHTVKDFARKSNSEKGGDFFFLFHR